MYQCEQGLAGTQSAFVGVVEEWQADLGGLVKKWAAANDLEVIDLRKGAPDVGQIAIDAGLRIGSVDAMDNKGMISADKGKR